MAKKRVEQSLFNRDDHRMKRGKHFKLSKGPGGFMRLKKEGKNKIIRSKFYSRFMDVVGKLSREEKEVDWRVIHRFVNRLLTTRPMKFLRKNVYHHLSRSDFKEWFMDTWFSPLSEEPNDCMFKHVFCGKMGVNGRFEGCHNWIEISVQEHSRRIEYEECHRFISDTATDEELILLADSRFRILHTDKRYYRKNINTVFVGTSPAFDLALYSHIFKNNETLTQSQYYRTQSRCRDARRYKACIKGIEFDVFFNYRGNRPSSVYPGRE